MIPIDTIRSLRWRIEELEGERDRMQEALDDDPEFIRGYLVSLQSIEGVREAVEDIMAAVKHCDEEPNADGLCCCAQRMGEVIGGLTTARADLAKARGIAKSARKMMTEYTACTGRMGASIGHLGYVRRDDALDLRRLLEATPGCSTCSGSQRVRSHEDGSRLVVWLACPDCSAIASPAPPEPETDGGRG